MEQHIKRSSKRVYPNRKCRHCGSEFIPHDAREIYCSAQHRIDYNNDMRRSRNAPVKDLMTKMLSNEKILKKFYNALQDHKQEFILIDFLIFDKYDFNVPSDVSIIKNGNKIEWQLSYGLEGFDQKNKTFKIHKR